jgi:hypothetical protein
VNLSRDEKITLALSGVGLAAWLWIDAFLTILERTGGI